MKIKSIAYIVDEEGMKNATGFENLRAFKL